MNKPKPLTARERQEIADQNYEPYLPPRNLVAEVASQDAGVTHNLACIAYELRQLRRTLDKVFDTPASMAGRGS